MATHDLRAIQVSTNLLNGEGLVVPERNLHSHAEGFHTEARGDYSHSDGVSAVAAGKYSFVWNGDETKSVQSRGDGTAVFNPVGGEEGFYVGDQSLKDYLDQKADLNQAILDGDNGDKSFTLKKTGGSFSTKISADGIDIGDGGSATLTSVDAAYQVTGAGIGSVIKGSVLEETDGRYAKKTVTVNGKSLASDVELSAADVGAYTKEESDVNFAKASGLTKDNFAHVEDGDVNYKIWACSVASEDGQAVFDAACNGESSGAVWTVAATVQRISIGGHEFVVNDRISAKDGAIFTFRREGSDGYAYISSDKDYILQSEGVSMYKNGPMADTAWFAMSSLDAIPMVSVTYVSGGYFARGKGSGFGFSNWHDGKWGTPCIITEGGGSVAFMARDDDGKVQASSWLIPDGSDVVTVSGLDYKLDDYVTTSWRDGASVALGKGASVSASADSLAMGYGASVKSSAGSDSIAIGYNAAVTEGAAGAAGEGVFGAVAIGYEASVSKNGVGGIALGTHAKVEHADAITFGSGALNIYSQGDFTFNIPFGPDAFYFSATASAGDPLNQSYTLQSLLDKKADAALATASKAGLVKVGSTVEKSSSVAKVDLDKSGVAVVKAATASDYGTVKVNSSDANSVTIEFG